VNQLGSSKKPNNVANTNAGDELGATQLISGQIGQGQVVVAVGDYLLGEFS